MPSSVELVAQGRILYYRYYGKTTIDDIKDVSIQAMLYLNEAKKPLYVIIDFSELESLPAGVIRFYQAPSTTHVNNKFFVLVSTSRYIHVAFDTVMRLANNKKYDIAYSLESAYAIIRDRMREDDESD